MMSCSSLPIRLRSSRIAADSRGSRSLVAFSASSWNAVARDSSVEQMAQRAKKILQEEGSHRAHAEAWARRLARQGGAQRQLLVDTVAAMWEHAGRWIGPDDDRGYRAAIAEGTVDSSPAQIRTAVRRWLVDLLAAEDVALELPEPDDWSNWDPAARRLAP
jgi:1,2-phenylacetyl-CoA epoxidase catalytic subunit